MSVSRNGLGVVLHWRPDEALVCMRIAGEIDMIAEPALADAVERLSEMAPRTVILDVAAVTFACSTLANLLVRMHNVLPVGASLVVCRPTGLMRRILALSQSHVIATARDDLPREWDCAGSGAVLQF